MRSSTFIGIWIFLFFEKDHRGLSLTCETDTTSLRDVIFCSTAQERFPEWCHCRNSEVDLSKPGTIGGIGRSLLIYPANTKRFKTLLKCSPNVSDVLKTFSKHFVFAGYYFSAAHEATISNCTAPRLGDICLCPAGLSDAEERKCKMCHSEGVSQMLCLTVDEYDHVIINDQNTDDAGCNITELCSDECEKVCGLTRNEIVPPSLRKIMALSTTQEFDPCDTQPCFNDGTCATLLSLPFCYCKPPFYGIRCENSRDIERKTTVIISIFLFLVVCVILLELVIFLRIRFCTAIRNEKKENIVVCQVENICDRSEIETGVDLLLKNKEVSHDKVILREMLGEGEFGVVYKGVVHGINRNNEEVICAIKLAKDGVLHEDKEDLLDEMKLLADLGDHRNILTLLACCSRKEPYYLVTEFMKYGDLLTFLRKCRKINNVDKDPTYYVDETKQVFIAYEITSGMAYIEEKRFYHGDLAARNILVGDNLTIKISDFGLADDIYTRGYKRREVVQKIPIKWCSLETILKGICTSQGDVWSFAVLLYEVFTLGGTPYPGIPARYLVSQLRKGYRMEQTENCPDDIYELMLCCWREDPNGRPTFHAIREQLNDMLAKRSDYLEFEQEDETFNGTAEGDHLTRASYMSYIFNQSFKSESVEKQRREGAAAVEKFAPILEEENDIELTELEAILHKEH